MTLLRNIARYLAGTIGNPITVTNVVNSIYSSGRSTSPATVDDYITALTEPYLFYPVERYDIQGKQILKFLPVRI